VLRPEEAEAQLAAIDAQWDAALTMREEGLCAEACLARSRQNGTLQAYRADDPFSASASAEDDIGSDVGKAYGR